MFALTNSVLVTILSAQPWWGGQHHTIYTDANLPVDICTDSQFVYNLCHDFIIPHSQLVQQLRSYTGHAVVHVDVAILKVHSHAGKIGNTRADRLAFGGVTLLRR